MVACVVITGVVTVAPVPSCILVNTLNDKPNKVSGTNGSTNSAKTTPLAFADAVSN